MGRIHVTITRDLLKSPESLESMIARELADQFRWESWTLDRPIMVNTFGVIHGAFSLIRDAGWCRKGDFIDDPGLLFCNGESPELSGADAAKTISGFPLVNL